MTHIEFGRIYAVDRGYVDFAWLWPIHRTDAHFVTRLKTSIKWTRVVSRPVDKELGLRVAQEIQLTLESALSTTLTPRQLP